jgi:hypothetical protein
MFEGVGVDRAPSEASPKSLSRNASGSVDLMPGVRLAGVLMITYCCMLEPRRDPGEQKMRRDIKACAVLCYRVDCCCYNGRQRKAQFTAI